MQNKITKEELLKEIEALLSYTPEDKTTINPNYLEYLELEDLESIKKGLIAKIGKPIPFSIYEFKGVDGILEMVEKELKILTGEIEPDLV